MGDNEVTDITKRLNKLRNPSESESNKTTNKTISRIGNSIPMQVITHTLCIMAGVVSCYLLVSNGSQPKISQDGLNWLIEQFAIQNDLLPHTAEKLVNSKLFK